MISKEKPISQITLFDYFSDGIHRESKEIMNPLSDDVIHYLTHLLIQFSESNRLFNYQNNEQTLPTLALLYEEAYNAATTNQRTTQLKQLGDTALFIGALFFEHYAKKGINKDYFIGMGGGAYSSLGELHYKGGRVFVELAENFPRLLQIIANVCSIELTYNATDIFSLLERWQSSKNTTLKNQLHSIGIVPFEFNNKH